MTVHPVHPKKTARCRIIPSNCTHFPPPSDMSTAPLPDPALIAHAAELIDGADAIIVAAGAGMGVDSGLPDFRGNEGFWKAYPALAKARLEFTRIANPSAFEQNPALAWGFYGHRLKLYRDIRPHAGFEILKEWGESKPNGWAVFTSNVDGQFQKAGFSDGPVHECHGSIHHLQCLEPCCDDIWSADDFRPDIDEVNCLLLNEPPTCPHCGGLARPNILMFGDWGWLDHREARQDHALARWIQSCRRPVVIEIGAGTAIASVRAFSHQVISRENGRGNAQGNGLGNGRLVRINPRESQVPGTRDVGLATGALTGLRLIQRCLQPD
jgi:NAD-dependent SIR2 family protein deacetylase